jgi:hypothetical protein
MIARAQLNGGAAPLEFFKWNGQSFSEPGMGGSATPLLPDGPFENCGTAAQVRSQASLSYVEQARQYLLVFVCSSLGDPVGGVQGRMGSAWFYSTTSDLSDPSKWAVPKEIEGTWAEWVLSAGDTEGCAAYKGWHPSLMSLDHRQGRLALDGFAFYLSGCSAPGSGYSPPREFSSRRFTISLDESGEGRVVEYFNPDLGHYFITVDPNEQRLIDAGGVGRWSRTGASFRSGGTQPVCRFFGNLNVNPATGVAFGPNSHFFTVDRNECAYWTARQNPHGFSWILESDHAFQSTPATLGACPGNLAPVYRAFNGNGLDPNHRITSSYADYRAVVQSGWRDEGVVMCAPN